LTGDAQVNKTRQIDGKKSTTILSIIAVIITVIIIIIIVAINDHNLAKTPSYTI